MKPGKVIFCLFVVSAVGAAAYSYRHSDEVYRFYLTKYYLEYRKVTPEEMQKEAQALLEAKRYAELKRYCERALLLFPKHRELNRLLGLACFHTGEAERGARLLLGSLDRTRPNPRELYMAAEVLYRNRLYTDLVIELARFPFNDDMALTFMYGVAYFRLNHLDEAERWLRRSQALGNTESEVGYYLGMIAERTGRSELALELYRGANRSDSRNREIREALSRLYKKMGRYGDAARVPRRDSVR